MATTVTTSDAANITYAGAELWGLLSPDGQTCTCGFQYGKAVSLGSTLVSGVVTAATYFGATLTGLEQNMVYYFRAYATYGVTTVYGTITNFKTLALAPSSQAGYVWIESTRFHFFDSTGVHHSVEGT